ncbi:hypothetical protein [Proteus mirabilis]|uniref:hypothetical protein n=1 Tax=Proteus mirabilis TaxID=584 RepID=UPI0015E851D4|nr:hypothetical protein [Proteus mirabilis]
MEYGIGIANKEENEDIGLIDRSTTNTKVEKTDKPLDKEWIILEPLSKDKSTYRWQPFN